MKNWINIALIATLAVSAGCAKVDVVETPGKPVSFTVGTYVPQTRGTSALDSLGITSFSSRAFLHGEGVDGAQRYFGTDANPVETIRYSKSGTVASWLPSHDYYWPKSSASYVNFFSWCGGDPALTYSQESGKYKATMTWSDVNTASLTNLMFADVAWHFNANAKTYLKEYDGAKVEEGVPTLFHHALAQVKFVAKQKVVDNTGVTGFEVVVNNIELTGVKNTATSFTLTATEPDGTDPTTTPWTVGENAWTGLSGNGTITYTGPSAALSTTTVTDLSETSVLPQPVEGMKLKVSFTVKTTYGTKVVEEAVVVDNISLTSFDGGITSWEFGKKIIYTIIIDPDAKAIKLIPEESNWIDMGVYPLTV